jgi:tetratricopeptide (TPR) repeat protein
LASGRLSDQEVGSLNVDVAKALIDEGSLVQAESALQQAERYLGETAEAQRLCDLHYTRALLLRKRQLAGAALAAIERALDLGESAHGRTSRRLATPLQLKAGLLAQLERFDEAREHYERALALDGLRPWEPPKIWHNLAELERKQGRLAEARERFTQVLRTKEEARASRASLAATLTNLGAVERDLGARPVAIAHLRRAVALESEAFGPDSVDVNTTRVNLAGTLAGEGCIDEACAQLERVLATQSARLADPIGLGTDLERLAVLDDTSLELQAYLGLTTQVLVEKPDYVERSYRQVLARKGLGAEAYVRDRYEALTAEVLTVAVDSLERLREALPAGSVLVELIEYGRAHIDMGPAPAINVPRKPKIGAFIVEADRPVRFVDLGPSETIEELIGAWLAALENSKAGYAAKAEAAARLGAHVWAPLAIEPARTPHVILSPDGALDRLSFAGLNLGGITWVADLFELSYIASGRELLARPAEADRPGGPPLVMASPIAGPVWEPLPWAEREGREIAGLCGISALIGVAATAEALLGAERPRFLHVAGHGIYCNREATKAGHPVLEHLAHRPDPMERSAMVMAVRDAAAALATGDPDAAGIVTARQIGRIDLRGTEAVVLSACDSGRGDAVPLDGTHGLRRAFRAAGAHYVISSFWPVSDRATPELMRLLYRELLGGAPPSLALAAACRIMKRSFSDPRYWAAFFAYGPPRRSKL